MARKARRKEDDDEEDGFESQQLSCTTLDHVYPPNPLPDTRCYCGKKTWKPFIKLDDYLKPGELIRMITGGPVWRVEYVNESRARCRKYLPGHAEIPVEQTDSEDLELQGKVTNISPRSAIIRVTEAELAEERMTHNRNGDTHMASKASALPVAGKSLKEKNADRKASLLSKKPPKGSARPLTGAAAKAKANAKPKVPKTVRKCACGCGDETMSYFVPGHDARYKGWMKKIAAGTVTPEDVMNKATREAAKFKKVGPGFKPTVHYDGEPMGSRSYN